MPVTRFEDMRTGEAIEYSQNGEAELKCETVGMNAVRFLLKLYIGANAGTQAEVHSMLDNLLSDADTKLIKLLG